jgi:hypothetical protein
MEPIGKIKTKRHPSDMQEKGGYPSHPTNNMNPSRAKIKNNVPGG